MRTFTPNRLEIRLDHARVELTRGQWAIIDTVDIPLIASYRWCATPNTMGGFYAVSSVAKQTRHMHRVLMSPQPRQQIDHINHDTLDNRRCNLRLCSNAENAQNRKGAYRSKNSSGVRGVCIDKIGGVSYWKARVMLDYLCAAMKRFPYTDEGKAAAEMWVTNERARLMPSAGENTPAPDQTWS